MVSNYREDLSGELRSGEETVLPNSFLDVVVLIVRRDLRKNTVFCFFLVRRAKVVVCALNGQNTHPFDGSEVHLLPAVSHQSARDIMLHEDLAQAPDVELFGHVEHGKVLVIEARELGCGLLLVIDRVLGELGLLAEMGLGIEADEAGQLVEPLIKTLQYGTRLDLVIIRQSNCPTFEILCVRFG